MLGLHTLHLMMKKLQVVNADKYKEIYSKQINAGHD